MDDGNNYKLIVNYGYYMVLQYANDGNLREYLKANFTKLQWIDKLQISKEIVHGLLFLHNHNIIHRDLHSKNILIHQKKPKIADLGLSKQINETSMNSNSIVRGMPAYVEPQCILKKEYQRDKRSDVYSAGVILWEISSGKPPFENLSDGMIYINVIQEKREESIEETLENFCLLGGIPIIINFASKYYNYESRVESAIVIQQICDMSSRLPFERFIDCGCLESLVEPLQEDYDTHKELILIMINGISKVLYVQNISVKKKLCKMLDNNENMDLLAITLKNIISDKNLEICNYTERIMKVLSEGKLIETIMGNTSLTTKILKEITISSNNLNASQKEIIIKILIVMLDTQKQRDINSISYNIFIIIFSMCHSNKILQETAKAGIVTHLLYFAKHQNFNKIALIMLFKMASAGRICEDLLWENYHEILGIYFSLLDKQEYQVNALEAISKWLQEKTSEVEQIIVLPENINRILKAMDTTKENSIENGLNSLHKIIQSSLHVSYSLAHEHFFKRLLHLSEHHQDFAIRFKLLKILRSLCDDNPQREFIINKYKLVEAIEKMSGIDSSLQVKELTKEIDSSSQVEELTKEIDSSSQVEELAKEIDSSSSQVEELAKEILSKQYFSKEHFNQNIIEKYCLTKGLIIDIREILQAASFLLDNNINILSFQSERSKWFTVENRISKSTMNPLVDNTSTNDVYLEIQYPQAEIFFEKENIQPSEELENEVKTALNNQDPYHQLMKVFARYGHFFAQKITLGQRLYRKSQFTLNEMPGLQNEVFDGAYDIGDKLTLWEDHIKQHNLDSTYLISNDGDLVQRDGLEKWTASCFEYPHKSLKIIKKSNLTPLYEIFNDPTIQNIQSVLGISDRYSGQLTTHEINERVLMTGVLQIREPINCYHINFDTHLKSHDYKVFGNVVNEKHQIIEGFVVNFCSENKSGFSIIIERSKDAINAHRSELQINWILVGKPEIGFYSVNTRNIRILHKGITQFTPSDEFISLKGLENLPSSSILVTSFSYPSDHFFIAKIPNYNNNDLKLIIINYSPLDFDESDDDSANSDESDNDNDSIDLH
ncbi:map kinase kinase kinase [Gigaspora margarita]|uniref:Map kinase kinase kinase n=1 Tax=Gigaspora margarita TaxID=4874 RepID=A0A8H3XJ65_GIGMA|nr:map kinase kinase kinase [Gigaspora margarita]